MALHRRRFALLCAASTMTRKKIFTRRAHHRRVGQRRRRGHPAVLKTFAAFGVHGTSAIACLTAQNPKRVLAVVPSSPKMLRQQIEAVFAELPPRAVKTGMLFSAADLRVVADFFQTRTDHPRIPLVVDPVMVSTSGTRLLAPAAEKVLGATLLPLATLLTPNLAEAEIWPDRKSASRKICAPPRAKSFPFRLRRPRQRRAPQRVSRGAGHFLRWPVGTDALPRPLSGDFPPMAPGAPTQPPLPPPWRWVATCRARWNGGNILSLRPLPIAIEWEPISALARSRWQRRWITPRSGPQAATPTKNLPVLPALPTRTVTAPIAPGKTRRDHPP